MIQTTSSAAERERSRIMSLVKSKDTKPELLIRGLIFKMGYRYRLHQNDLPGCPDIVFRKKRKAIYVHGCFWHLHPRCPNARLPKTKRDYWIPKLRGNQKRDIEVSRKMIKLGWSVLILWECELSEMGNLAIRINDFLGN